MQHRQPDKDVQYHVDSMYTVDAVTDACMDTCSLNFFFEIIIISSCMYAVMSFCSETFCTYFCLYFSVKQGEFSIFFWRMRPRVAFMVGR